MTAAGCDVAIAERLDDGSWSIACADCPWTATTASETGALRAFEAHAGPWLLPRQPGQATGVIAPPPNPNPQREVEPCAG